MLEDYLGLILTTYAIYYLTQFLDHDQLHKPVSRGKTRASAGERPLVNHDVQRSMYIAGLPTTFGRWLSAFASLFYYPSLVRKAYLKMGCEPFAIPTLSNYHIFVSDQQKITELSNAPVAQLSFNAFLAESLSPEHTMNGFRFEDSDPHNKIAVSTLKNRLRSKMVDLGPGLQDMIELVFTKVTSVGKDSEGWINVSAASVGHQVAAHLNCFVILGEKMARDPGVTKAAMRYARDAAITSEVLHFAPDAMKGFIAYLIMNGSGAYKQLERAIVEEARVRMDKDCDPHNDQTQPEDCLQWTIEALRGMDEERKIVEMTRRLLSLLFAAAYQAPMLVTFALYNLCKHPGYLQPLKEEIDNLKLNEALGTSNRDAPLLDSFLKETARCFPLQAGTMDRKAMKDFTFSDGTHVPAGNLVCVPQNAMMLDPDRFVNAESFRGFRFVATEDGKPTPARFYVCGIAKMILVHIIKRYEFRLASETQAPSISWGPNMIPHPNLKIHLREKDDWKGKS
ncbi:MAG: hypothetical protein M1831_003757 [Alyxoria varia]|nr:MAG: hypothetical protein M1831_003757 [Alyxoria varia]